ncbi:HpcH/HpaI aldolase/citrate lyase family protein [Parapusillimonas granuli]|uniref:CoA ester lyase n=1 Tax=Parapusillimonas granuli TaxID=380911 RepID=A0A853GA38_9BURK|nr:CoA ester lyase [Parapusillimonas granuli]MBB5216394.1 citrate lyase subunit beta/citryl-CoA lyase [Parapusillimonas granuli]NYT51461.1 CoA ester lyase [Parapusillimonas granuli]
MIRSLFFAPANRPDLVVKFPRFSADCSVIDLEDGTPSGEKAVARTALAKTVDGARKAGLAGMLAVRVNVPDSPHYLADLEAAFACDIDAVVIPKLESPAQALAAVHWIEHGCKGRGRRPMLIGGLESVRGVLNAVRICDETPYLGAVYFGAEDFAADIGGRRTRDGDEVATARGWAVMAARAAGLVAFDQAVLDIRDDALFTEDARRGRDMGYQGKICVAPAQVALAHAAFSPTQEEIDYARRLVDAYEAATARGIGTIDFEGKMVDGPLLKRSQAVLAAAGAA